MSKKSKKTKKRSLQQQPTKAPKQQNLTPEIAPSIAPEPISDSKVATNVQRPGKKANPTRSLLKQPLIKKLLFMFYLFLIGVTLYHYYYADKVIPGVTAAGMDLSGMTREEVSQILTEKAEKHPEKLQYVHNETLKTQKESVYEIATENISLVYDVSKTVDDVFKLGRTGNFFYDTRTKILAPFQNVTVAFAFYYDEDALARELLSLQGEVNELPVSASYAMDSNGDIIISSEKAGRKMDSARVLRSTAYALKTYNFSSINVATVEVPPAVATSDLEKHKEEVKGVVNRKIVITAPASLADLSGKGVTLEGEALLGFFTLANLNGSSTNSENAETEGPFSLEINRDQFNTLVEELSKDIRVAPRGRVSEVEDNKVVSFEVAEAGQEIDKEAFFKLFETALKSNSILSDNKEVSIEIPMTVTSNIDISEYGIVELLAEGESNYRGSGAGRVTNILLSAQRASGILVPPGGIYSFNETVGKIDKSTGYATAYVISGGRTVLGDGGGVCQTSTSLFRAVLNAGLPVITRHPHAYRVIYYELDTPPGVDASIFQPSLDFKFKNDTENHILVQMENDPEKYVLKFQLFGTKDGREVELSKPTLTNVIPAPTAMYQDDPTLPKGTVKQVDFAAAGGVTNFNRKVTKDGEVLIEENYTTKYTPWRAVYLVGTKEN